MGPMRIGDVGTVSPSGDLLAFSMAVILVVSLSIRLLDGNDGERQYRDFGPGEIELVLSWGGIDPDEDGKIEFGNGQMEMDLGRGPFPIQGRIGLVVSNGEGSAESLFNDGKLVHPENDRRISSPVRGVPVMVEADGRTSPGTLSIFTWEESN